MLLGLAGPYTIIFWLTLPEVKRARRDFARCLVPPVTTPGGLARESAHQVCFSSCMKGQRETASIVSIE